MNIIEYVYNLLEKKVEGKGALLELTWDTRESEPLE